LNNRDLARLLAPRRDRRDQIVGTLIVSVGVLGGIAVGLLIYGLAVVLPG
jgi:hypothetical protein